MMKKKVQFSLHTTPFDLLRQITSLTELLLAHHCFKTILLRYDVVVEQEQQLLTINNIFLLLLLGLPLKSSSEQKFIYLYV